jgi:hypothetical protein
MVERRAADYKTGESQAANGGASLKETAELLTLLLREVQRQGGTVENPKQRDIDYVNAILRQIDAALPRRGTPSSPAVDHNGRPGPVFAPAAAVAPPGATLSSL